MQPWGSAWSANIIWGSTGDNIIWGSGCSTPAATTSSGVRRRQHHLGFVKDNIIWGSARTTSSGASSQRQHHLGFVGRQHHLGLVRRQHHLGQQRRLGLGLRRARLRQHHLGLGRPGDNIIWGSGGENIIWGSGDDNIIWGSGDDNIIWGSGGDNIIWGSGGDNIIWGSSLVWGNRLAREHGGEAGALGAGRAVDGRSYGRLRRALRDNEATDQSVSARAARCATGARCRPSSEVPASASRGGDGRCGDAAGAAVARRVAQVIAPPPHSAAELRPELRPRGRAAQRSRHLFRGGS